VSGAIGGGRPGAQMSRVRIESEPVSTKVDAAQWIMDSPEIQQGAGAQQAASTTQPLAMTVASEGGRRDSSSGDDSRKVRRRKSSRAPGAEGVSTYGGSTYSGSDMATRLDDVENALVFVQAASQKHQGDMEELRKELQDLQARTPMDYMREDSFASTVVDADNQWRKGPNVKLYDAKATADREEARRCALCHAITPSWAPIWFNCDALCIALRRFRWYDPCGPCVIRN